MLRRETNTIDKKAKVGESFTVDRSTAYHRRFIVSWRKIAISNNVGGAGGPPLLFLPTMQQGNSKFSKAGPPVIHIHLDEH
jgi:hypothetical protein